MISAILCESVWVKPLTNKRFYYVAELSDHSEKKKEAFLLHSDNYQYFQWWEYYSPVIISRRHGYSMEIENVDALKLNYARYRFSLLKSIHTWIGITGTNGKTTTLYFLEQLLSTNYKIGSVGTLGVRINQHQVDEKFSKNTSLPLFELLEACELFNQQNCEVIVMEASSIGFEEGRLLGVPFTCMIAHRVTQDHLDYHQTFSDYLKCKQSIVKLADKCVTTKNGWNQGLVSNNTVIALPKSNHPKDINECCAMVCCEWLRLDYQIVDLTMPPGRLENYEILGRHVIVDYAHTPDALKNLLEFYTDQQVTVILGCGGDRDREKRMVMGTIAENLSRRCIITMDNPRTEDCLQPLQDINQGAPNAIIIPDRRLAIWYALETLGQKELLVIAGKGNETTIEFHGHFIPFSDRQIILEWANQ